jgi:hypothetical protein
MKARKGKSSKFGNSKIVQIFLLSEELILINCLQLFLIKREWHVGCSYLAQSFSI